MLDLSRGFRQQLDVELSLEEPHVAQLPLALQKPVFWLAAKSAKVVDDDVWCFDYENLGPEVLRKWMREELLSQGCIVLLEDAVKQGVCGSRSGTLGSGATRTREEDRKHVHDVFLIAQRSW